MLTLDELKNARIKTRRRNRHFIYGTAATFGLLAMLLGSGWLFIPNIVPFLAGSALLVGSPLTVLLFGLAGIALGLFVGKQMINLGRSLLHILHGEKPGRSWLRVGFAVATAALVIPLTTTGVLPIAATGFASVAIATAIVLSSIAVATFLAKHLARSYAYFTEVSRDTDGYTRLRDPNKNEAYIQQVTNPAKENFTATELTNLERTLSQHSHKINQLQAIKILRRLNQHVTQAKWQGDEAEEAEAKAARDLLHFAAQHSVNTEKALRRFEEVRLYATNALTTKLNKAAELNNLASDTAKERLEAEHANENLEKIVRTSHEKYDLFANPIGYSLHVLGLSRHRAEALAHEKAGVKDEWHLDRDAFEPILLRSNPAPKLGS